MKKKLIAAVAVLAIAGCAPAALAAKSSMSPFTDNLFIQFQGYPADLIYTADYYGNNGVNITGPASFDVDSGAEVTISSKNLGENGYPSAQLMYWSNHFGEQTCTLTFVDGPWTELNFKNGVPPTCQGLQISKITPTDQYGYSLTVSYYEPSKA